MPTPSKTRTFAACVHCGRTYRRVVPGVFCVGCGEPRAHRAAAQINTAPKAAAPLVDPWFATQETEAQPRGARPPTAPHVGCTSRPRIAPHLKRRSISRPEVARARERARATAALASPDAPEPARHPAGPDLALRPSQPAPLPHELLVASGLRAPARRLATRLGLLGAILGAAAALIF